MSEIRHVSYSDILNAPNAQALLDGYAAESSVPEIGSPDPQVEMYAQLESAGVMQCLGAYVDDGNLVGFASVLVSLLPHYGQTVAIVESIYVAAGARGALGAALMRAVEQYALEKACIAVLYSAPAQGSFERLLSMSPKYHRTNSVFCRRLA